jgi:hypothetical protein
MEFQKSPRRNDKAGHEGFVGKLTECDERLRA